MLPTIPSLRLAELLAARLCHDLAGPLGVLSGVLELAGDAGDMTGLGEAQEIALRLGRQLRLRRAAWASEPEPLDVAAMERLAEGLPRPGRIRLDLSGLARQPVFAALAGRLVLNLLLLGTEALPGDGLLTLAGAADSEVMLRIEGTGAAWPGGLAATLSEPALAWECLDGPRGVQMPLTVLLAAQAGYRLGMLLPLTAPAAAPPPLLLRLR